MHLDSLDDFDPATFIRQGEFELRHTAFKYARLIQRDSDNRELYKRAQCAEVSIVSNNQFLILENLRGRMCAPQSEHALTELLGAMNNVHSNRYMSTDDLSTSIDTILVRYTHLVRSLN